MTSRALEGTVPSQGFTVIEMTVAVALLGLILLLGSQFIPSQSAVSQRIRSYDESDGREARAFRWLASALGSLEIQPSGAVEFDGTRDQVVFRTRLLTGQGWYEPVRVQLFLSEDKLQARLSDGRSLMLVPGIYRLSFEYLMEPGEYPRWGPNWSNGSSAPAGLRMLLERVDSHHAHRSIDTLLWLVRGSE